MFYFIKHNEIDKLLRYTKIRLGVKSLLLLYRDTQTNSVVLCCLGINYLKYFLLWCGLIFLYMWCISLHTWLHKISIVHRHGLLTGVFKLWIFKNLYSKTLIKLVYSNSKAVYGWRILKVNFKLCILGSLNKIFISGVYKICNSCKCVFVYWLQLLKMNLTAHCNVA